MKKFIKPLNFFQLQIRLLFKEGTLVEKLIFLFYFLSSCGLFFYSYTQIDLGLVITREPRLYAIEKLFQYVGYFNRPVSTALFIALAVIFLFLYFCLWELARQKKIHMYTLWSIISIVTIVLLFSYNAFSYDLFNYIFDAKIITHYHQNPYLHRALDYPADPMLGFMHWIERIYPYGPVWLMLTVPLSFIGANIFVVTFFLFKLLVTGSFLTAIYYLYRLFQNINQSNAAENLVLFALNPLILYECLISSHNDIVMMAFSVAALFYLTKKKYWLGSILLLVSIGVKFATVALIPVFLFVLFRKDKENLFKHSMLQLCFALMLFPLLLVTVRTIFQPWYLLYVLPFVPFVTNRYVRVSINVISAASIFLYIPYLATGQWHSVWYTFPEKVAYWLTFAGVIYSGSYLLYIVSRTFNFRFAFNKQHA